MDQKFLSHLQDQLQEMKESGLYKEEREIASPQKNEITLADGKKMINLCSNNYLGLANHPDIVESAKASFSSWGFGLSSVRFICGTLTLHKELEKKVSEFLQTEDTILYSSCFDANGGLFETILGPEDAVISDSLNHASIIDGIRLSKADRFRYQNNDMNDLEEKLKQAKEARFRLIATDGVFSMDGKMANLPAICDLAEQYKALVMVDDCHATGFMGENGRGTPEFFGVSHRIDILTGTFGKALGGASGGYTSGKKEIIEFLRQKSRPYLFSNTLAPNIAKASMTALDLVKNSKDLRKRLFDNAKYFREKMTNLGFTLTPGEHPIIPIMIGNAKKAKELADLLLEEGIYVISFSYPVVPKDQARIRVQMSSSHSKQDLDKAIQGFEKAAKKLNLFSTR